VSRSQFGSAPCSWKYRFDRLLPDKLAHVYQLLVSQSTPVNRRDNSETDQTPSGVNDEQASSDFCARVLGLLEGESHHRQPDGCADRIRTEERIQCAARMGIPGRRV
jgi:hypothetical protein